MTLKKNTAKYYFGKKSSFFAYLPKNFLGTKKVLTPVWLNCHNLYG
jgi:hypothetical protein